MREITAYLAKVASLAMLFGTTILCSPQSTIANTETAYPYTVSELPTLGGKVGAAFSINDKAG